MSEHKYRINKKPSNYSVITNDVSQGLNYNLEALGLFVYIYSLPDSWEFYKSHLQKVCNIGIKKLNSLLKILADHGLINEGQERSENGQFSHFNMTVNDCDDFIPLKNNSITPQGNFCRTAKTVRTVKRTYKINKDKINNNKIINTPLPPIEKNKATEIVYPEWLNKEQWEEFKEYRKEIKKPLTPIAEKKCLSKLSSLREKGNEPCEVINQTIENNWKGFFGISINSRGNKNDKLQKRSLLFESCKDSIREFKETGSSRYLSAKEMD